MSNFKPKVLPNQYPKLIQSFCKWNLFIFRLSVLRCLLLPSCLLSFQRHRIDRSRKEYRESMLGLHGRSEYGIFINSYHIPQFINTAISEDVMTVSHSLESPITDVKSAKCTSPWNLSGRSVVFVEIPAFNHSDLAMQMKIPYLISRWLTKISYVLLYFQFFAIMEIRITFRNMCVAV